MNLLSSNFNSFERVKIKLERVGFDLPSGIQPQVRRERVTMEVIKAEAVTP